MQLTAAIYTVEHKSNTLTKEAAMPYVNFKLTPEGLTASKKEVLIKKVTELLVTELNKNPDTTFVTIEEVDTDNWGIGGKSVTEIRKL